MSYVHNLYRDHHAPVEKCGGMTVYYPRATVMQVPIDEDVPDITEHTAPNAWLKSYGEQYEAARNNAG